MLILRHTKKDSPNQVGAGNWRCTVFTELNNKAKVTVGKDQLFIAQLTFKPITMPTHGLKSDKIHPYQKSMNPFWRHSNLPPTMGYSEATKEALELQKLEYDVKARYVNWQTR